MQTVVYGVLASLVTYWQVKGSKEETGKEALETKKKEALETQE